MTKDTTVKSGVKIDKSDTIYGKKLVSIPSNIKDTITIILLTNITSSPLELLNNEYC